MELHVHTTVWSGVPTHPVLPQESGSEQRGCEEVALLCLKRERISAKRCLECFWMWHMKGSEDSARRWPETELSTPSALRRGAGSCGIKASQVPGAVGSPAEEAASEAEDCAGAPGQSPAGHFGLQKHLETCLQEGHEGKMKEIQRCNESWQHRLVFLELWCCSLDRFWSIEPCRIF